MNQNQQAERLAQLYADAILRLSYTYLKNTDDAQDICQTVFVKLLSHPRTFDTPEHEKAYILRMAANACKDVLRSPWRSVLAAVNQLPENYRTVLYLFYYEGYQAEEIGRILGISKSAVHVRLNRGREKLKTYLEEDGYV